MLHVNEGLVHIEGRRIDLVTDFMLLARTLLNKGVIPDKEELILDILIGCSTEKELQDMLVDAIDNMDDIGEAFKLLTRLNKEGILK